MSKYTAKRGINKHDAHIVFIYDENNRLAGDMRCASINRAKRLIREWPTLDNATVMRLVADYDDQN